LVLTAAATAAVGGESTSAAPATVAAPAVSAAPAANAAPLAAAAASRAAVTVGPILITVPDGFQAAQTQRRKKSLITAWTHSVKSGASKTLLQIEVLETGKAESAERHLHLALEAIARRRSNFSVSPPAHIQLAGVPALRASWNGSIGGYAVVGVVYTVAIKDRYVVKLLTQDLGNTPTDGIFAAMQAIEAIRMS